MSHSFCHRFADDTSAAIENVQGTGAYLIAGPAGNVAQVAARMRELDASGIRSEFDDRERERLDALDRRITNLETALAGR